NLRRKRASTGDAAQILRHLLGRLGAAMGKEKNADFFRCGHIHSTPSEDAFPLCTFVSFVVIKRALFSIKYTKLHKRKMKRALSFTIRKSEMPRNSLPSTRVRRRPKPLRFRRASRAGCRVPD